MKKIIYWCSNAYKSVSELDSVLERVLNGSLTFIPFVDNKLDATVRIVDHLKMAHYIFG